MSRIDWTRTQTKLTSLGWGTAGVDGVPGKRTYAALFGYAAGRQPDAVLLAIGLSAATVLPAYHVADSTERLAEFLAQTCHETGGYTRFEENMHYSARRLMAVWPRRFPTLASAMPFAWDPSDPDREDVALANLVYGGRMGNELNGTQDNDGWDHRGGGMLQHTGAAEYAQLKLRLGYESDDVRDPAKAVVAACDYWQRRSVNSFCDRADWSGARRAVNGGTIGLEEVAAKRTRVLGVLT